MVWRIIIKNSEYCLLAYMGVVGKEFYYSYDLL